MNLKLIGGILLIVGTSIGGGMLALPISATPGGLMSSSLLLLACWAVMTFCAFLILEINLRFPAGSNFISMAQGTLGKAGAWFAWLIYLLLFYCLLAAYSSSGADMLRHTISTFLKIDSPAVLNTIVYAGVLGFFVYMGVKSVDYLNRLFMVTKFIAFFILVGSIATYIDPLKLGGGQPVLLVASLTIMITAFGYSPIIPSLRTYFNGDVAKLRMAILIGSLIPLLVYIIWNLVILGVVPRDGQHGLLPMLTSGTSTTDLPNALSYHLNNEWITILARIFGAMAIATSFLGVALSTSDFLADGLKMPKVGRGKLMILGATFIPPLAMSIFYPNAFIQGLRYAGICCTILLIIYPALMAWRARYNTQLAATGYQVMGGKAALIITFLIGVLVTTMGWLQDVQGIKLFG
jgi:tyrosine-specific transport protein